MDIMCADYYFWYHVSTLVQEVSCTHVRMLGNKEKIYFVGCIEHSSVILISDRASPELSSSQCVKFICDI